MVFEVLLSCAFAAFAVSSILLKSEVRNCRQIALRRKIEPCPSAKQLSDFLDLGTNEKVSARYFYEVPIIRLLFRIALILTVSVLLISAIGILTLPTIDMTAEVPKWATRGIYFSVVVSLVSSLACGVIATTK